MTLSAAVIAAFFANTAIVNGASPDHAAKVISTTPADGAAIRAGSFTLSVTYDRPMQASGYSFVAASAETYPACGREPARSPNGHTFSLRCSAAPGRSYEVWFNRRPYMNFRDSSGRPAEPYRLRFTVAPR